MTTRNQEASFPARTLYDALEAAEQGEMPSFTTESLLHELKLDGDYPDGLPLADRLIGDTNRFDALRTAVKLMREVDRLIVSTNEHRANSAQETIAQTLGCVVTRQIIREGNICPGAAEMALMSTRPDIIPREVQALALLSLFVDEAQNPPKRCSCRTLCNC